MPLALALALSLVACSGAGGSDDPAEQGAPGASAPAPTSAPSDAPTRPSAAPCGAPAPAPKLASSPVTRCVGYFSATHSLNKSWLHRTPEGCTLGIYFVLHDDGTASDLNADRTGTWEGDEFYFRVKLGQSLYALTRTEGTPSE